MITSPADRYQFLLDKSRTWYGWPPVVGYVTATAFLWYVAAQLFAVYVGSDPNPTLFGTVSITEAVFCCICVLTGLVLLQNLSAARYDQTARIRLKLNGSLELRANAALRNERQRAYTVIVYLFIGGLLLVAPSAILESQNVLTVLVSNALVSAALYTCYCSVMDHFERSYDLHQDILDNESTALEALGLKRASQLDKVLGAIGIVKSAK